MGYKLKDLIGNEYGRLVVVEQLPSVLYGVTKKRRWKCFCSCGNETEVDTGQLTSGNTKSCGCLHSEQSAKNGKNSRHLVAKQNASLNVVKNIYKSNARKRNLCWELTDDETLFLLEGNCFYCGLKPSNTYKTTYHHKKYNGIDRLDNTIGYTKSNVVSCCKVCNHAKHTMHKDVFLDWLQRIFDYQQNCRRAIAELEKQ